MIANYYDPINHKGFLPVRVLTANIKDKFFNIVTNFDKEFERLLTQFGLKKKIIINTGKKPLVFNKNQLPYISNSDKYIRLHEVFLSFLWIICYSLFVVYDESMVKKLINLNRKGNFEIDENLSFEALELFNYALSLINNYTIWDKTKPNPEMYDNSNKYIEYANAVFEYAVAFILAHEFAHLKFGHTEQAIHLKSYEYEADEFASELLIDTINSESDRTKIGFGIIAAISSILYIDATLSSSTHPDRDERLKTILERLDLPEIDNLWGMSCLVFKLWKHTHNIELVDPNPITSYKDLFYLYLKQLSSYKLNENLFQLTIDGRIIKEDILDLKEEMPEINVSIKINKIFIPDVIGFIQITNDINLLFSNFDTITFLRDFIFSAVLAKAISKSIQFFLNKGKKINSMRFELEFKKRNGKKIIINFSTSNDNYMKMFKEADKILNSDMIDNFADNKIIWVSYKDNQVNIQELG